MAIYALLDIDTLNKFNISIEDFIKTSKGINAKLLQYRDKNSPIDKKRETLKKIRKLWNKKLIVNDNIELLELADGIHIGQEDLENLSNKLSLSKKEVIEYLKKKTSIVGLSTHNIEEIKEANNFNLNYIGLGAYRKTSTKDTNNILGNNIIELIKFSYHKVAIIGGVKIYDKIPAEYKVIGSDICRLISTQSKKKMIFKKK